MTIELVIAGITMLCSVFGAWIVVKIDIAKMEERLLNIEAMHNKQIVVTEKLTETLNGLQVTLACINVEMRHLRKDIEEVKQ